METESITVVARGWEEMGMETYCQMGTEFKFYKKNRVLEMDGGNDYTTM